MAPAPRLPLCRALEVFTAAEAAAEQLGKQLSELGGLLHKAAAAVKEEALPKLTGS